MATNISAPLLAGKRISDPVVLFRVYKRAFQATGIMRARLSWAKGVTQPNKERIAWLEGASERWRRTCVHTERRLLAALEQRVAVVTGMPKGVHLSEGTDGNWWPCPSCGDSIQRRDNYCPQCGARLEWRLDQSKGEKDV